MKVALLLSLLAAVSAYPMSDISTSPNVLEKRWPACPFSFKQVGSAALFAYGATMPQYRSEMMTCVQQLKANFRSNCQDPYSTHGSTFCQCCAIVGDLIRPDASANAVNNMFDNAISRIPSMPWPVYISVSNEGSSDFMLGLAVTCSPFQYMGFDTCGKWNKGQRPSKTEDFGNWPKGSAQEQHYKVRDELFNSRDGESRGFPIVAGNPFNMTSG